MKGFLTILISAALIASGCSRGGQPPETRDAVATLADEAPDVTVRVEEVDPPQAEHQGAPATTEVPAADKVDTDAKIKTGDEDGNSDTPSTPPPDAAGQEASGQDGTTTPLTGQPSLTTTSKPPTTTHHRRKHHSTPSYDKGLQDLLKDKKPKDPNSTGDAGGGDSTTGSTTDSTTGGTTGGGTSTDGGATTGDTGV